jgi:hypothetical protein
MDILFPRSDVTHISDTVPPTTDDPVEAIPPCKKRKTKSILMFRALRSQHTVAPAYLRTHLMIGKKKSQ